MNNSEEQFGVSTLLFREYDLDKTLSKLKLTGLKNIDLSIVPPDFCPHYLPLESNPEEDLILKEKIVSNGFNVISLNVFPGYFNTGNPETVKKFLLRTIQIASILEVKIITIPTGTKVEKTKWTENVKTVCSYINELSKAANNSGIVISLETPHLRTLTETLQETLQFYDILNNPDIKCTFDTSHAQLDVTTNIAEFYRKIGSSKINHIHLRDSVRGDVSFTPGKGNGNFRDFFRSIKDFGYKGKMIFELEYHDLSEENKFKELNFALEYSKQLFENGRTNFNYSLKTNNLIQFFGRFTKSPKSELARYPGLFKKVKIIKPVYKKITPVSVYTGRWDKKYFIKVPKPYSPEKNSVIIDSGNKIYKIAIVGCGWAGTDMHAPGFQRLNNCRIVGGYDIDKSKSKSFANRFNCAYYDTLESLLEKEKPDIVSVCSREWAHSEPAILSMENGADVFSEKILASRYEDAKKMVEFAKTKGKILAVNYNYRFMPALAKLKEIIEKKIFGKLLFFNINVTGKSYAHALDLLSYFGGKIITVSGAYNNDDDLRPFNTDWSLYDKDILYVPSINASVTCEFENKSVGVVNSSFFYDTSAFVLSVEALFEEGAASVNELNLYNTTGRIYLKSRNKIKAVDMDLNKNVYTKGWEYTFFSSIESFIKHYITDKDFETDGNQGLLNIELERAVYSSVTGMKKIDFQKWVLESQR